MICRTPYLQIFLLGLLSSAVLAQRAYWNANPGASYGVYSGFVSFICPNGAVLMSNQYISNSFQADNNLPYWYDCQPSFMNSVDGIITVNVTLEGLDSVTYTVSKYKSEIFRDGIDLAQSSLDRIGFQIDSGALVVTFLGPSCGNGVREYLQFEDCDNDSDSRCLFCACVDGSYADYNDFTYKSCNDYSSSSSYSSSSGLILGIVIPIAVVVLILIVVLRVLCIRGIIMTGRRRRTAEMEIEMAQQQAVEGAVPQGAVMVVQQPGVVPLDQGVQPGQYPNYIAPAAYPQVPLNQQQPSYVVVNPSAPYGAVPKADPNAQPYITANYAAQPVAQFAPNNNNINTNVVVASPPPPNGAFATN